MRPGTVDIWLAELAQFRGDLPVLRETLSVDERERASRFRFERDRDDFVIARALLRRLLARYLLVEPGSFVFQYGPHGKPSLGGDLRFNLAHSAGFVLIGLTLGRDIGVDIERIRPDFATLDIAERFFAPEEVEALKQVPEADRAASFFVCWARKEAFIKAKGMGVFLGLDTFAVSLRSPPALLRPTGGWTLFDIPAPQGYTAAAAVDGTSLTLHCQQLAPGVA